MRHVVIEKIDGFNLALKLITKVVVFDFQLLMIVMEVIKHHFKFFFKN